MFPIKYNVFIIFHKYEHVLLITAKLSLTCSIIELAFMIGYPDFKLWEAYLLGWLHGPDGIAPAKPAGPQVEGSFYVSSSC